MHKPKAIFRFSANSQIGAGHAMRCLVLAEELRARGWECTIASEQESYDFVSALDDYERIDPDAYFQSPIESDLLIVDHYDLAAEFESHFRPFTKAIMVIDDKAAQAHDCDIILDQTYGRERKDYEAIVPQGCDILVGSLYALLRSQFQDLHEQALKRRKSITSIERVLLNFGGNDQRNMILASLKKLHETGYKKTIDIVFGFSAQHRESVESYAGTMPNDIIFHENVDMAQMMVDVDFAIGTPSVTSWERACLGLPSLLLLTNDIQSFCLKHLVDDEIAIGDNLDDLMKAGILIDFDYNTYMSYVERNIKISDGMGASRVADTIEQKVSEKNGIFKKISNA